MPTGPNSRSPEIAADSKDPPLEAKLDFLRDPHSFPDAPQTVGVVETHFAWVFLSKRFVYKLKKPIRFQNIDFTSVHTRRANCELEVTLNRRLAAAVYIGVVPLTFTGPRLCLEGDGPAVDWLVKMHRLPAELTLERKTEEGAVSTDAVRPLVRKLAAFYARAPRAPWTGARYRRHLARQASRYAEHLAEPALGLESMIVDKIAAAQRQFIDERAPLLEARIGEGRVVDAHGDLRPEHVFLTEDPQIIDCLEFAADLRLLDAAEEMLFLALEVERLGGEALAADLLALYRELCEDPVDEALISFYRSQRAFVRALLSAWHLDEDIPADKAKKWRDRAHWYLAAAHSSIHEALG
jgi:aminoglycoside phosphotransferase family enzyme